MILSIVIAEKFMPGNDDDVWFQTFIKKLKELWLMGLKLYILSQNKHLIYEYPSCRQLAIFLVQDIFGLEYVHNIKFSICIYDSSDNV